MRDFGKDVNETLPSEAETRSRPRPSKIANLSAYGAIFIYMSPYMSNIHGVP